MARRWFIFPVGIQSVLSHWSFVIGHLSLVICHLSRFEVYIYKMSYRSVLFYPTP
ncbi:hypothetical protein [Coleofasciculus sp. F4-SAH-05]|uniref:hypothetical protein n=1 Tax=Coleofasciculus sp. F4-SAH-05 TaxID=3069525 RepID=UPI0032F2DEE0